jgi:hypothetical protein
MLQRIPRRCVGMRVRFVLAGILGAVLFGGAPGLAHHSNVAFEVTKVITITGVVKTFEWRNPHTWVLLTVDDGKGGKVDWAVEAPAGPKTPSSQVRRSVST